MTAQNANTVLAMQNVDVLRAIQTLDLRACVKTIADATDRDQSNLRKTLVKLEAAGLIAPARHAQIPLLTEAAKTMLKAADVADGREPGIPGFVGLLHAQIMPSVLNPRRDFDSDESREALDELRQDILQNGLLQNLLVRSWVNPDTFAAYFEVRTSSGHALPLYEIIAGERRWRAIGAAIADGDWPEDRLIPCQVITTDDRGHTLRALAENLQRRALNPLEEAHAFRAEVEAGMSTAELAERLSVTQRYIQLRMQLLELGPEDQARMLLPKEDEAHLSVTKARKELQQRSKGARQIEVLPPDELLMLLEIAAKIRRGDEEGYYTTEIGPDGVTLDIPPLKALIDRFWVMVHGPSAKTGRYSAQLLHQGRFYIDDFAPGFIDQEDGREAVLSAVRDAAGAPPRNDGTYATPWLNGPFDLTDEGRAVLAKREAEAQAKAQAEADAAVAMDEEMQRGALFLGRALAIEAALRQRVPYVAEEVEIACAEGDAPLPWAIDATGNIVDAIGRTLKAKDGAPLEARRRLLVAGINALAGLVTPDVAPSPPGPDMDAEAEAAPDDVDLDRPAFEAAIAAELAKVGIAAGADVVLDAILADEGIEYGHPDYGWTADDAKILVHEAYLGE